jgi:hypothetical protein
MSLEAVVSRFKDGEKKRNTRSEPDGQAEIFWPVRRAPSELLSSIKVVSNRLNVTRSVLTKCMSRHAISWYEQSASLSQLTADFNCIYAKIKQRGYPALRHQADNLSGFEFVQPCDSLHISISTIAWVLSELRDIDEVARVGATDLLLLGFCWSLTTLDNQDWDRVSIETSFAPEVANWDEFLLDRITDVQGLSEKYDRREQKRKLITS